jgi:peroxiredoxin Q/BCP
MTPQSESVTPASGKSGAGVQVGDRAPDFTLPNQNGEPVSLHDFLGKRPVAVYFYPKDETAGCTAEACSFRDSYEAFQTAGAEVIGISGDSAQSHQQFAQHHRLPFVLLSDQGNKVRKLYGVPPTLALIPGRVTYIIDRQGIVRHIFSSQFAPTKHVAEALHVIEQLREDEPPTMNGRATEDEGRR